MPGARHDCRGRSNASTAIYDDDVHACKHRTTTEASPFVQLHALCGKWVDFQDECFLGSSLINTVLTNSGNILYDNDLSTYWRNILTLRMDRLKDFHHASSNGAMFLIQPPGEFSF
jgi:hypothetical protein